MQFKRSRELKKTRVEIIPMIDTIFFLLVFFMLSSLSLTRLNGLPVQLPKTRTAPPQAQAQLTLTVAPDGAMQLNGSPVTEDTLATTLRALPNPGSRTVTINADERVAHGVVIRAVDTARRAGVTRFSIATSNATP